MLCACSQETGFLLRKNTAGGMDMDLQGKERKGEEHQSITKIKKLLAVR